MSNWGANQWSVVLGIVTLVMTVTIAVLQIRQQRIQGKREPQWREKEEIRNKMEREEALPKLSLGLWDGDDCRTWMAIKISEPAKPVTSKAHRDIAIEVERERLILLMQVTDNADPARHDQYLSNIETYIADYEIWHSIEQLKHEYWILQAQFVIHNNGQVPVSAVTATIDGPSGLGLHQEDIYHDDGLMNKKKPLPPKVPRIARPVSVDQLQAFINDAAASSLQYSMPFAPASFISNVDARPPKIMIRDGILHLSLPEILAGTRWVSEPIIMILRPNSGRILRLKYHLHGRELVARQVGTLEISLVSSQ